MVYMQRGKPLQNVKNNDNTDYLDPWRPFLFGVSAG
jgi:hypothetical protein